MNARRSSPVICIAGVVQGSRRGTDTADQGYRERIRAAVLARYPDATIFCPVTALHETFAEHADQLAGAFMSLQAQPVVMEQEMPELVLAVRERFRDLVHHSGRADVLVAYVPAELSMGTAMEMWAAYSNGRPVVTISPMNQNLAIVSTSTVLLPSLEAFEAMVSTGGLDRHLST